jgi:hypothetical protein
VSGVCGCGEGSFRIFRMAVSGLLSKYGGSLYKSFFVNSAENRAFQCQFFTLYNMSGKESSLLLSTGLDKSRVKNIKKSPYGPLVFLVLEFLCLKRRHYCALYRNPIHVFPEIKLSSLVPISYIHVSVSDLYIPRIGLPFLAAAK